VLSCHPPGPSRELDRVSGLESVRVTVRVQPAGGPEGKETQVEIKPGETTEVALVVPDK